jgi:hypothetical protein
MAQGLRPIRQRVQVLPTREACETLRATMMPTLAQTQQQVQQAVEARASGTVLRMQTTLVCQEES